MSGTDLPIPEEAVEAGAAAYWESHRYAPMEPEWSVLITREESDAEVYRSAARVILTAALPLLGEHSSNPREDG